MGVFNLIETFFFLSLAITFVLILLLVNHFKQRVNTIEQKCDTMFEIINNMMQQIDSMVNRMNYMRPPSTFSNNVPFSKSTPEVQMSNVDDSNFPSQDSMVMKDKIVVSDDDDEDEDDEDEDDEDEDDEDEDEDEEDYDENDLEYEDAVVAEEPKIKIINVDIDDTINVENLEEDEGEESPPDLEEVIPEVQVNEDSEIQIEKVENDASYTEDDKNNENPKDVYSKMTVQDLKKLVITKGLCSDASKLKKNELLKLLETTEP